MKRMINKKAPAALLAACMLAGLLAGCGGAPTIEDPGPAPVLEDNMLDQDKWQGTDGAAPADDGNGNSGYELSVEANTDLWDSLMRSYDQDTESDIGTDGAGAELAAITGNASDGVQASVQEEPVQEEPAQAPGETAEPAQETGGQGQEIEPAPVAMATAPLPLFLKPEAPGTAEARNANCAVDYSNISDGYFMAAWLASPQKIKLQCTGPTGVTYTYDLSGNSWAAFPLSDGNGHYDVRVMQCVGGTKYAVAGTASFDASMADEFAPFLRPNQYVNYENEPNTTDLASQLCTGKSGELDKVAAIYDWVVASLSYDHEKAKTVQSGYLPDLDSVLASRKGICFDYAALMAGMLRSQGVACRLVVGYAGTAYHAWISVYVEGQGWVDGVIFFNGQSWQRMDPTFASSGGGSESIMKYIGDGSNYSARYLY